MAAATPKLGRLERVDLRSVWVSEPEDFTPWLAAPDNIGLLGEAIGMDLEVETREKDVGPFRADILCRDANTDQWVLIENQLERTDHVHLGQLLTYAAGLKAVTIVWVARSFTDEHRAALDWLNEVTDEHIEFFGLEVEAWRIDESPPAPKFNLVSKPNDWTRRVATGAARAAVEGLSETKQLQLQFWTSFREYADQHAERIRMTKPPARNWWRISVGRPGFHLCAIANPGKSELRAEFLITHDDSAVLYEKFFEQRTQLDRAVGEPLGWNSSDDVTMKRIFLQRTADLEDRAAWPDYHRWLAEKLDKLDQVFRPHVRSLDLEAVARSGSPRLKAVDADEAQ
jgi:hypothetical protein